MGAESNGPRPLTPRSGSAKAQQRQQISDRRKKANELFLSGWTQLEVAEQLGSSSATISTDLKALREEWRKENLATTGQHIDRELTSLAMDERDARDALAASHEQKDRAKWHEIILKIRDRRAKLLGLDAPTKVEQKTEVVGPLRIEYSNDWAPPEETKTFVLDAVTPMSLTDDGPAVDHGAVSSPTNGNGHRNGNGA